MRTSPQKRAVRSGELTDKQLSFIEQYAASHNATQAAIKAGYSADTAWRGLAHLAASTGSNLPALMQSPTILAHR